MLIAVCVSADAQQSGKVFRIGFLDNSTAAGSAGARGTYPVITTPAAYLSWFDPDGAMSLIKAAKAINPRIPVVYVGPKDDYPILLKGKQVIFNALPPHPLTKLYEPDSSHLDAPSASRNEIFDGRRRWQYDRPGT
jgi:hypothetical protein